jgi:hypothetical protein
LLGVSGPAIEWGAGAAFLIASMLADLSFLLIVPLLHQQGMLPVWAWISSLTADLLLTAAVVAGFLWVRNDAGAAALAAAGYTVLQIVNRVVLLQLILRGPHSPPVFIVYLWMANFLFLLILALAVRWNPAHLARPVDRSQRGPDRRLAGVPRRQLSLQPP